MDKRNVTKTAIKQLGKQFFKFGLVGISNTLIGLACYYVLVFFHVHYIIANTVGFVIGVLNSYYWNNRYVFTDRKGDHLSAIMKMYMAYGATFLLGTLLLYIMVDIIGISELVAPVINLLITVPVNFILNKYWAMK